MLRLKHTHSLPADTLITAFHSTPSHTILADDTGHIHIFCASGTHKHTITVQEGPVWALATICSTDGNTDGNDGNRGDTNNAVVTGGANGMLHVYAVDLGTAKASFVSPHTMPVRALLNTGSTSSSNVARSLLISSDTSGLILIWDVRSRTVVHALLGHSSTVPLSALLVLEADEVGQTEALLISGSYDGTVRAWGLNTGKELWAPKAGEEGTPEEDLEGTRGNGPNDMKDKEAELKTLEEKEKKPLKEDEEEIEEENEEEDRKENEDKPNAIFTAVGLGGGLIATGGMGGEVRIWDFKFESPLASWCAHSPGSATNHLLLHPSGLLSAGTDGRICLWDIKPFLSSSNTSSVSPPALQCSIQAFDHAVTAITLHAAGNESYVTSGGKDGGDAGDACGLDAKIIHWNLGRVVDATDGEVGKGGNEDSLGSRHKVHLLGGPAQAVWRVQSRGEELLVIAMRRGRAVLELWGPEKKG